MTTTENSVTGLIALADKILSGEVAVPGSRAPRAAAVVARQALEEVITLKCSQLANFARRPHMRSQLILLRHEDFNLGQKAQVAWDGLSQACHHHAYELQPTAVEVRSLLRLVRAVADDVDPSLVVR
jgi:hypothetical protein